MQELAMLTLQEVQSNHIAMCSNIFNDFQYSSDLKYRNNIAILLDCRLPEYLMR